MKKKPQRPDGYHSWSAMIARCYQQSHLGYLNYGGRGITVCPRWRYSFTSFMEDMGPRPSKKHSIERRNNDGNYEPSNCYWATMKEQAVNKRTNRLLTYKGETLTMSQWANKIGITIYALHGRLRKMTVEEAIEYQWPTLTFGGRTLTSTEWEKITGIKRNTICKRIRDGWTPEETLTTPVRNWGR